MILKYTGLLLLCFVVFYSCENEHKMQGMETELVYEEQGQDPELDVFIDEVPFYSEPSPQPLESEQIDEPIQELE